MQAAAAARIRPPTSSVTSASDYSLCTSGPRSAEAAPMPAPLETAQVPAERAVGDWGLCRDPCENHAPLQGVGHAHDEKEFLENRRGIGIDFERGPEGLRRPETRGPSNSLRRRGDSAGPHARAPRLIDLIGVAEIPFSHRREGGTRRTRGKAAGGLIFGRTISPSESVGRGESGFAPTVTSV